MGRALTMHTMDRQDLATAVLTAVGVALIATGVDLVSRPGYALIAAGVLVLLAAAVFLRLQLAAAAVEAAEEPAADEPTA